jgi:thiol-disulfide isomerase/thioredoxin/outer membrane lipoprotein-sorting protein
MPSEPPTRFFQIQICLLLIPLMLFPSIAKTQTTSMKPQSGETSSDALTFLDGILKSYADAKTYHIQFTEEIQVQNKLRRTWEKRFTTAIMLPNNRYRFEQRSDTGGGIQVSDGKSEWVYDVGLGEYTQQPASSLGPGHFQSLRVPGQPRITEAQNTLKKISGVLSLVSSATYLPDEKIDLEGKSVLCTVIEGRGAMGWGPRKIKMTFTYWIDKESGNIRKQVDRRVGPLRSDQPTTESVMERTTWFLISQVGVRAEPDQLFTMDPSSTARLVSELEDSARSGGVRDLVGHAAPSVNLLSADGKTISLKSFQGRPVLLDFWATWCVPCVESLPSLENLYKETVDLGLVILSIDENDDADAAREFLAKRKEPWTNFHYTDEIASSFPNHGIPFLVLIDGSGKVVLSKEGLDEVDLQTALAKLGATLSSLQKKANP